MKKILLLFFIINVILTNFLGITVAFILDNINLYFKGYQADIFSVPKIEGLFSSLFFTPYLFVAYVIVLICIIFIFFIKINKIFITLLIVNFIAWIQMYAFFLYTGSIYGIKYALTLATISIFSTIFLYYIYKYIELKNS